MASPKSIFDDIQPASIFDEISLPAAGSKAEPPQRSTLGQFGRSLALGTRDILEGAGGLAYDVAALPFNAGIAGYNAATGKKQPYIGGLSNVLDTVGMAKSETEGERLASAINRNAMSALTTSGIGSVMAGASSLGPVARGIGQVLASQPAMQVASGAVSGGVGEATDSPVAGMFAGALTPVAVAGARRMVSPFPNNNPPGRQALIDAAEKKYGIPVTAGQATGSDFLQNMEAKLQQLPFTSGPQRDIANNQRTKFIEAAWRQAGQNASDTSADTLLAARDKIGGTIGAIANRNTLQMTPDVDNQLATLAGGLDKQLATIAAPMRNRIEEVFRLSTAHTPPGGTPVIPGAVYRQLDTELGKAMKSTDSSDLRNATGELRAILRGAMDASISPADKAAWDTARKQYALYKTIESAAGQAGSGAAEGMMSPVALRGAVVSSVGKDKYAQGFGDLNELARIGQGPLKPRPDSNTSGLSDASNILRGGNVLQHGFSLGGSVGGAAVGGPVGAMIGAALPYALPRAVQLGMNSGPGQAYLRNQLAVDPILTKNLARALALHGAIQTDNQAGP